MFRGVAEPGQHSQREVRSAKQINPRRPGSSKGYRKNPGQDSGNPGVHLGSATNSLPVLGKSLHMLSGALWNTPSETVSFYKM